MNSSRDSYPADTEPPVFDPTRLNILMELDEDGDCSVIKAIAEKFLEEMTGHILRIEIAIAEKDFQQVARSAHSIKGSAATFGLYQVEKFAKQLEASAKGTTNDDAAIVCNSLREAFTAGHSALSACLDAQ